MGAPPDLVSTWFASTLRDGFALTAAGAYDDFASVAHAALSSLLAAAPSVNHDPEEAASQVLARMAELPLHDDVSLGLERLHSCGIRLVTLTNGSIPTTQELLARGGVAGYIEQWLSIEEVRRWKPAADPYRLAAERCGVPPEEVMLAAVHPWDVGGAKRAGLSAAWINRDGQRYPKVFEPPDLVCRDLTELAAMLAGTR